MFPFDKCSAPINVTISLENCCPASSGYIDYCELDDPNSIFEFLNYTFSPIDICFFFIVFAF